MSLVKLGTRGSPLALWQAHWCRDALKEAHPGLDVEIVEVESSGDIDLSTPLVQMGEVGIFTKTLERQLELGNIDLAVHSLKDVPAQIMDGTAIVAVSERDSSPARRGCPSAPRDWRRPPAPSCCRRRSWLQTCPRATGPLPILSAASRTPARPRTIPGPTTSSC